jgi:hypothetical protein
MAYLNTRPAEGDGAKVPSSRESASAFIIAAPGLKHSTASTRMPSSVTTNGKAT